MKLGLIVPMILCAACTSQPTPVVAPAVGATIDLKKSCRLSDTQPEDHDIVVLECKVTPEGNGALVAVGRMYWEMQFR